jgi:23S rRNA (cytidine2498-2'-O)-methyltransferase
VEDNLNQVVVTSQAEFALAALHELQRLDPQLEQLDTLAPGVLLCMSENVLLLQRKAAEHRPTFARHLAPVQAYIDLTNSERDLEAIALAIAELPEFRLIERGGRFAVQTRFVHKSGEKAERPYSSGTLNKMLAGAFAEENNAVEDIKKPQVVVSILCTNTHALVGISTVWENLSSWPGGARHYAQTDEQISRAEFKLLEALEAFEIELPAHGDALDLGAAPGGWSHILLDAGLNVTAVDPARLDPRLDAQPRLRHQRTYAEPFIADCLRRNRQFDIIVSDMRMDANDAALLLGRAKRCLRRDGFVISTLKLPHTSNVMDPLAILRDALKVMHQHYAIVKVRQLFHNRQEITLAAAHPKK